MIKINEFTICLHAGSRQDIVQNQISALEGLQNKFNIHWNNRIDRFPFAYSSYSQLINDSIISSPTEWMIMINDRCFPTEAEVEKIINLLENGFACVFLYNVGFMGFSKQLIRKIGWWDERYLNGGWEDVEWVFRLKMADLALYESQESTYSYDWKSPLQKNDKCALSFPHFQKKWKIEKDFIIKQLDEENYECYNKQLIENTEDIEFSWKNWNSSILNLHYNGSGIAPSTRIGNRSIKGKI